MPHIFLYNFIRQKKRFGFIAIVAIVSTLVLTNCIRNVPPYDSNAMRALFSDKIPVVNHTYKVGDCTMHYVAAVQNDTDKSLIVFIPGSPGTWEAFGKYLADPDLRSRANMIAVDRPGLGLSDPGRWEGSLAKQVAALAPAIEKHKGKGKVIHVGHSFGGPVATRFAIDRADLIDSMILLAASVDPALEKTKWFQYVADFPLLRWAVPTNLDVANQEIMALKTELQEMKPKLKDIEMPITVIQGTADKLVPEGNADYVQKYCTKADVKIIRLKGQNHFLPWNEYDLVKAEILKALE